MIAAWTASNTIALVAVIVTSWELVTASPVLRPIAGDGPTSSWEWLACFKRPVE